MGFPEGIPWVLYTTYLEVALVALSPRGHPVPGGAGRICCSDSTLVAS
jgi:hypothetical protein